MKTSLLIDDVVYEETRRRAVSTRKTIGAIVETALRDWLARVDAPRDYDWRWKPVGGGPPRVNVDDREALYDVMEGHS